MTRVGLIGCGAIGRPVARALVAGRAGSHSLAAVLARAPRDLDGFPVTDIPDKFLAGGHDLIIEVGGTAAFAGPFLVGIFASPQRLDDLHFDAFGEDQSLDLDSDPLRPRMFGKVDR